ncbi:MAG: PAS domain S-box protein [Spirochaetes bacterium]|nr:PAS domain S-box protein [Spirochaetota bacterium]
MKRILVADDIEENLYLLRALLEGHGYSVEQAANGSEALVSALAVLPDLIITDILMPVIDGFTLCRIWKSDRRLLRIPFIFYTATYTDPLDEQLAIDMGADAFIIKPTEPEDFLKRVEDVLVLSEQGKLSVPKKPRAGDETILKNYNEALIRKLEHKMLVLEKANRDLESEMLARDRAEKALWESEQRYRSLFENSMDGVLLTEPNGSILSANPEACRIFGRTEEEIIRIGRNGVVDQNDTALHEALTERDRTGRFTGELTLLRSDGSRFPCEVSSAMFRDSDGNLKTSMVLRDITERKNNERTLIAALQEKNTLIKEIHHRVKNNMQVISSMINLQLQTENETMTAGEVIGISMDLQNRIRSMAIVHDMLYRSQSFSRIDFSEYLQTLVNSLFHAFGTDSDQIAVRIEAADQTVSITTAIPLGMIINELLTNALKHAFPSGKKGEIGISMTLDNDNVHTLTVRDNGIGLPGNFTLGKNDSFGMLLVSILVEELGGTIEYSNNGGAVFTIGFKRTDDGEIDT